MKSRRIWRIVPLLLLISLGLKASERPIPMGTQGDYSDFGDMQRLEQVKVWRVVQYRKVGDTHWSLFSNWVTQMGDHVYGIWSTWANHPHYAAGHWKSRFKMKPNQLRFKWEYQTQPFPLGSQDWRTRLGDTNFQVLVGQFYRSRHLIKDKEFQFTMILLPKEAELPKDDFPL